MMRHFWLTLISALCAMFLVAGTAAAGLWEIIGDSATQPSEAVALSADGSVIVGSSRVDGYQRAYRWTLETGIVPLPMPESATTGMMTWATDVSSDGSVIVGDGGYSFGTREGWEGLVWEDSATPTEVAVEDKGVWLSGVSGDGSVAVGTQQGVAALDLSEAFRLPPGGTPTPLSGPLFPGPNVQSIARAISADGKVIVGDITQLEPTVRSGFRWTVATGMTAVGNFSVNAASRDGSVLVGTISGDNGFEAFRWTEADGVVPLGVYEDGYTSQALGVSGDGSRIVGFVEDNSTDVRHAFIWEEQIGQICLLEDVLVGRYGFDLTDWNLWKAYAISDDGRTVVGRAYSPTGGDEAFRAILAPEPSSMTILAVGCVCGLALAYRRCRLQSAAARRYLPQRPIRPG